MLRINYAFLSKSFLRLFMIFVLLTFNIFLIASLISYNPTDVSLFYNTTSSELVANAGGYMGSCIASLFFFLFGYSSYYIVIMFFLWIYYLCAFVNVRCNGERFFVTCLSIVVLSALLQTDVSSTTEGGLVGIQCYSFLRNFFDPFLIKSFLYTFLLINFVIAMRSLIFKSVEYVLFAVVWAYQNNLMQRVYKPLEALLYFFCIKPILIAYSFMITLFDGSLFRGTGLLSPESSDELLVETLQLYNTLKEEELFASIKGAKKELNSQDLYGIDSVVHESKKTDSVIQDIDKNNVILEKKQSDIYDDYKLPTKNLFSKIIPDQTHVNVKNELLEKAQMLEKKLERFGVMGNVVDIKQGPVVTLFEYAPDIDTKLSKIIGLEDDLAMALQALSIRIIAPIPGYSLVGFEVANTVRKDVLFSTMIRTDLYKHFDGSLPLLLGQDTVGKGVIVDLARMPHLLIAGSTGSGKSVALNTLLITLLCKCTPAELKLILIDPKRLEFMAYADIPHLLFPIVTEPKQVVNILRWVIQEMESRYKCMSLYGVRNIFDFNMKDDVEKLPFIVIIIDELSDLMLTVGRDIEDLIARIAQMARAAGIHMIVATQRPSVDVITGLIKVNFPSRISFRVTSKIDSRTILDCAGADKLLGRGDMLFLDSVHAELKRVHGAFVSAEEILNVVSHIKSQGKSCYLDIMHNDFSLDSNDECEDELYEKVLTFLKETEDISISLLQRKFRIGYNRSARIIEMLEAQGLIMPIDGGKKRKVIR